LNLYIKYTVARGSAVFKALATNRKVEGSRPDKVIDFFNLPHPSGLTKPWVYSTPNRNEYQKQKNNNVSGE
jgi:hypothetical protein